MADGHPHLELTQHLLMVMAATFSGDAQIQPGSESLERHGADEE
jgi:hypothetical protein